MSDVKKISDWTLKWLHEMTRDDNTSDLLETLFKPPKKIPKNVFFQHVNYRFPQGGAPPVISWFIIQITIDITP